MQNFEKKTTAKYLACVQSCDHYPHGLSWIKDLIETLGIVFTNSEADNYAYNFEGRINNLKTVTKHMEPKKTIFKRKNYSPQHPCLVSTRDTRLQTIQYKLINRIIPCK